MASTAVLCLEDVLCKGTPPNGAPIWEGLQVYHALRSQFRVVIDSAHDDYTEAEHWLTVNGLRSHALLLTLDATEEALEGPVLRQTHLAVWRSQGFDVGLYVTADPAVAALMMTAGVTTFLFGHPAYARPEFRPGTEKGMKPWAAIEDEVTEALAVRDIKPRVDADMQP